MLKHNLKKMRTQYQLYLLLIPTIVFFIIFHYWPMLGAQIAFRNFQPLAGIWGSPWVGFHHFERFFNSPQFSVIVRNTLAISITQLVFAFPIPIILALQLNHLRSLRFKSVVQTITYAPFFISMVVKVGMLHIFASPRTGIFNIILREFGVEPIFFFGEPGWFLPMFVGSHIWQTAGWSSIIYLAALSAIDPSLHEAAMADGASKLQRIRHIDLPGLLPTIVILLIISVGQIMNVGFEKTFLMQTPLNIGRSEVISTFVYKVGLLNIQYSYATAVGLFNSVINMTLLIMVNFVARRVGESSLW